MELRDLIVTPIWLIIIYAVAYWVRPLFTDHNTRRYFIPALTVRIIGAIAVGMVYQFYYNGGDTFTYHTRGSAVIWQAFMDNLFNGIKLLFAGREHIPELFNYTKQMWFYGDLPSYFVVRVAAFFDLLTFRTYSATAILFSLVSFSGAWALYQVFYRRYQLLHKWMALAVFFVPSVFFWGSGILKDTLTLAALGWGIYAFDQLFFQRKSAWMNAVVLLISLFILFSIKKYILLCFAPALIIWLYAANMAAIRNVILKILIAPFVLILTAVLAYWAVIKVGEDDHRYAIENIAETAQITAYDIAYWTGRSAGSTYTLGELDGTFESMFKLMPAAINVSLFRPYLWEVKNSLMLIAAIEAFLIFGLTLLVLYKTKIKSLFKTGSKPIVLFCLTFSIVFAFAVGVSTYNFGTLMRYKIPLMPFYISAMIIVLHHKNKERKLS